jgi:hypothetical protein
MRTTIRHVRNIDLWVGDLPPIPVDHQITIDGKSMRVMGSAIEIDGAKAPTQLVVVEPRRD